MRSSKKRRTVRAVLAAILSVAMAVSGVPTNALAEAAREVSGQSDGWEMPDEQVTSEQLQQRANESVPEEESTGSPEQPQEQPEQDSPEPSSEDPPAGDEQDAGSEQVPEEEAPASTPDPQAQSPADQQVPEEEAPASTPDPEAQAPAGDQEPADALNAEGTLTYEDTSIKVTATLANPSALPAGTVLVVKPVTPATNGYDYDAYLGALNDSVQKEDSYNEKNTLLYDVSFVATDAEGNAIEVEPAEGTVTVSFEFKQQQLLDELGAKKADDVAVTRLLVSDGKIEVEKSVAGIAAGLGQVEITTDRLSAYAFSCNIGSASNALTYSIAGETNILLSKLLETLGIKEDVANVKDVTFTDTDFVKVEKKGDDWLLTSLKPFTSDETLAIEFFSGAKCMVTVTYDQNNASAEAAKKEDRNAKNEFVFEDSSIKVVAKLDNPASLPKDVRFEVTPITKAGTGYDYDAYLEALNNSADNKGKYSDKNTLLYDVAFLSTDRDGKIVEVQPAEGSVKLAFEFKRDQLTEQLGAEKASDVEVTHLPLSDKAKKSDGYHCRSHEHQRGRDHC